MLVHSSEISSERLLKAVVDLPKNEFERLLAKTKEMRRDSSVNQVQREVRLIKRINEAVLSDTKRTRFDALIEKRRNENITDKELTELLALTEKSDNLNVKRLKYLSEIASIRNKNLRDVMKELEISASQTI